jgi:hypothetical protein
MPKTDSQPFWADQNFTYGVIHLVTTTFGQWLCSGEIMVKKFFEFYTPQNSQIISINVCLHALMSICMLH